MGSLFRRTVRRPLPKSAVLVEKNGRTLARWKTRGKAYTAPVTVAADGTRTVTVETGTYTARYRTNAGRTVERSTGCRDETNARQKLAKWEKEAEQISAGVLDAADLDTARAAAGPIGPHLDAYTQALVAAGVSGTYKANAFRAVRRLTTELGCGSVRDIRRDKVEQWLADAVSTGMGARTRNYYRDAVVRFANWLRDAGRLGAHDLNRLPKADERADPKRQRRALTPDEIERLLAVAVRRPLDAARTVRRGKRKGEAFADLRPEVVERLHALGRERVLVYRTLIYTGLRLGELRTLTVARLDLTPGAESLHLEVVNEKNRDGSTIPLRADLSADLRRWIGERGLAPTDRLFTIPGGLRLILDRDMKAAGIPKRDERGRTVDVHAMRTTFGTLLSTTGTAPRTAQAAMRHSDIRLTMGTYTDPRQLDVREAVERLPGLAPRRSDPTAAGSDPHAGFRSAHDCARTGGPDEQFVAHAGTMGRTTNPTSGAGACRENAGNVNDKPPVTTPVVTGGRSGRRDLNPRPLAPQTGVLSRDSA